MGWVSVCNRSDAGYVDQAKSWVGRGLYPDELKA